MTPQEVLQSSSPEVKAVIEKILQVEKANRIFENLAANKPQDQKVIEEIVKIIYQGTI